MASVLDLAELSLAVYQGEPTSPLPEWSLVDRYPRGTFFAALYRRREDGEHVLAVRGTEVLSPGDWWSDGQIIGGWRPNQFPDLQCTALHALTVARGPLYVTGHSL